VERETERLLREQSDAGRSGRGGSSRDDLERYLHQIGKSEEEVRAELRPVAEKRLRHSLVLSELAEAEHIEVTDAEVEAEIERLVSGAGSQAEELRRLFSAERAREGLGRSLRTRKTIERLAQIASGAEDQAGAAEAQPNAAEEG